MRARRVLAWTLVAMSAAWAAARLLGLEHGFPLVPLLAYTPVAAVGAVVAAVATALLRQWLATLVAAVLAIALVGVVAPRAVGGPSGAAGGSGPTVGVLTVNTQHGAASPEAIVALARSTRAHLLSLQEIDAGAVARLEAAGLGALLPERVVRLGVGTGGTALFARLPLRPQPGPEGTTVPMASAAMTVRGAAPVDVVAIHPLAPARPSWTAGWHRDMQALPAATPLGRVRILAGDFNATLDHAELRRLLRSGYEDAADQVGAGLRPTWPVGRRLPPPVTIDHVLADRRCGVRAVRVASVPGTDHRAVFAEIVLPASG